MTTKYTIVDLGISGSEIVEQDKLTDYLAERDRLTEIHGHDQARVLSQDLTLEQAQQQV